MGDSLGRVLYGCTRAIRNHARWRRKQQARHIAMPRGRSENLQIHCQNSLASEVRQRASGCDYCRRQIWKRLGRQGWPQRKTYTKNGRKTTLGNKKNEKRPLFRAGTTGRIACTSRGRWIARRSGVAGISNPRKVAPTVSHLLFSSPYPTLTPAIFSKVTK